MTVLGVLIGAEPKMSDDEGFRTVFEDHLTFFKKEGNFEVRQVSAMNLYVHNFSWIGLLNELGVSHDMHWFTIRLNGGESLYDTPTVGSVLLVPNPARLRAMYTTHISRKGRKK